MSNQCKVSLKNILPLWTIAIVFIITVHLEKKYTDIGVEASVIHLDQGAQTIKAYGAKDTTGNPLGNPKLTQGETTSNSDSIFYNLKSQKGLTKGSYLQEGEMYVYANTIKKID